MKIAVYCSASSTLPKEWHETAAAVGRLIGEHKGQLIYGGVDLGLMSSVSHACKEAGGTVVGVVPMRRAMQASPINDVRVPTSDLNDRKGTMQLLADLFVVLPGGYGTLDEFATSFAYINFSDRRDKSIVIYNPQGIYNPLLTQLKVMADHGLMDRSRIDVISVASTQERLLMLLEQKLTGR